MSLRDDDGGGNDYDDEDKNICGKKQERDKECQQQRNGAVMGECCESRFKNKKQSVMEYQIAHNCQIKAESHFECVNSPRFHFTLRQWVFLFFIFFILSVWEIS